MSLLEKLKEQQAKEKIVHPLKEESFEIKTNYLKAIAYFIVIDEKITEKEKEKFVKLIDALECKALEEELLEFLQEPNIEEFNEVFEHIGVMRFGYYYLVEVLHLDDTQSLSKNEEEFIALVLEKIGVSESELSLMMKFYQNNNNSSNLKEINKKENLQNAMHEIALYLEAKDPYISFWVESFGSQSPKKDDKEIVLEAVKTNKWALQDVSERLKDDKEIVLEAVRISIWDLKYASERLKDDKDVVLEGVKRSGWDLKYASERLKDDKEIVLEAVKSNGVALQYASERLKYDKDFVLEAVKSNGWALEYASERFKNDKDVVLEAVKSNGRALEYASERLQNDKELQELCNQIKK